MSLHFEVFVDDFTESVDAWDCRSSLSMSRSYGLDLPSFLRAYNKPTVTRSRQPDERTGPWTW